MLLIRADATVRMGTGHVMRCLALAQAWRELNGDVLFVAAQITPGLQSRLNEEGFAIRLIHAEAGTEQDAAALTVLASPGSWVVVDGYQFTETYQVQLKQAGLSVLFVDDYGHCVRYVADLVLNQNLGASEVWYSARAESTRLLLGPGYALLREEFLRWALAERMISEQAKNILITLGGSDPDNVSLSILKAIDQIRASELTLRLIVGGSNPHGQLLSDAAELSPHQVEILQNVTDMAEQMMWADLAVCAGGSSNWEMSFLGLPRMVCVLAENQRRIADELHRSGAAVRFCLTDLCATSEFIDQLCSLIQSPEKRRLLSEKSQQLVDGQGAKRVCDMMRNWPGGVR